MKIRAPGIVAHADWSVAPAKRWLCVASRHRGAYVIAAPEPVGVPAELPERLVTQAADERVLLGVDFPLGVPLPWARSCRLSSFRELLERAGGGAWRDFYELCEAPEDIRPRRPFYPKRPGGTAQQHLVDGLGLSSTDALRRRCERRTNTRNAASPLFWTLGGQQVGRAAISGWQELLKPAARARTPGLKLWPFDGGLARLLEPGVCVVAETYPAESATQIGLKAPRRGWSKRRQSDRAMHALAISRWAFRRRVTIGDDLLPLLRDGFPNVRVGEDQFDALLGVCGMLEVIVGGRPEMPPMSNERRVIEGWILGQR